MSEEKAKVRAMVPVHAGEHAVFGSEAAESFVGQVTKDGWTVIAAEQRSPSEIMLTVEGYIPANLV